MKKGLANPQTLDNTILFNLPVTCGAYKKGEAIDMIPFK
jgi:hypothetical protein